MRAAAGPSVALPGTDGRGTVASLPRDPAAPEPASQSAAVTPPAAPRSVTSPPHEPPPPRAAADPASQSAAVTPPAALGSVTSLPQEQPPLRDPAAGTVSQESSPEATSHGAGPPQFGSPQGDAAASLSGPSETLSTTAPDFSGRPVASPAPVDEVKAYLWSVYQRSPTKADGHGDFTSKDVSAAGHAGLSVEDYVIGGIDPDFAELLFAAGHAMDAAGVEWTILSGFRDDFRQNLAAGLKARAHGRMA
jgi:hypothetical protein